MASAAGLHRDNRRVRETTNVGDTRNTAAASHQHPLAARPAGRIPLRMPGGHASRVQAHDGGAPLAGGEDETLLRSFEDADAAAAAAHQRWQSAAAHPLSHHVRGDDGHAAARVGIHPRVAPPEITHSLNDALAQMHKQGREDAVMMLAAHVQEQSGKAALTSAATGAPAPTNTSTSMVAAQLAALRAGRTIQFQPQAWAPMASEDTTLALVSRMPMLVREVCLMWFDCLTEKVVLHREWQQARAQVRMGVSRALVHHLTAWRAQLQRDLLASRLMLDDEYRRLMQEVVFPQLKSVSDELQVQCGEDVDCLNARFSAVTTDACDAVFHKVAKQLVERVEGRPKTSPIRIKVPSSHERLEHVRRTLGARQARLAAMQDYEAAATAGGSSGHPSLSSSFAPAPAAGNRQQVLHRLQEAQQRWNAASEHLTGLEGQAHTLGTHTLLLEPCPSLDRMGLERPAAAPKVGRLCLLHLRIRQLIDTTGQYFQELLTSTLEDGVASELARLEQQEVAAIADVDASFEASIQQLEHMEAQVYRQVQTAASLANIPLPDVHAIAAVASSSVEQGDRVVFRGVWAEQVAAMDALLGTLLLDA